MNTRMYEYLWYRSMPKKSYSTLHFIHKILTTIKKMKAIYLATKATHLGDSFSLNSFAPFSPPDGLSDISTNSGLGAGEF
jgi:hypothetical protein